MKAEIDNQRLQRNDASEETPADRPLEKSRVRLPGVLGAVQNAVDAIAPLVRVVDDDDDVRRSWAFVMEGEGWDVASYPNAAAFLAADDPFVPGCLILDVRMSGMTGIELQHEMKAAGNPLPIIFVSAHGDINMAVKTIKEGAADFLPKPVEIPVLVEAVRRAIDRDLAARREVAEINRAKAAYRLLSAREKEVARGVSEGLLNKQIAWNMHITEKTVIAHRSSLCRKLGIRTAADITRLLMTIGEV